MNHFSAQRSLGRSIHPAIISDKKGFFIFRYSYFGSNSVKPSRPQSNLHLWFLIFLLVFLLAAPFLFSAFPFFSPWPSTINSPEKSFWYLIKIGEKPVGYAHEHSKEAVAAKGSITMTTEELKLVIRRLGANVEMASLSEWEETEQGELIRVSLVLKLSSLETRTQAEVAEKEIIVRSTAGGKEFTQRLPYSGRLLGPESLNRLTLTQLRSAGEEIEFLTYSPELNQVVHGKRKAEGREEISLPGFTQPIKTLKITETIQELPTKRVLWVDERGRLVQYLEPSPLGELKVYLSTEEAALAAARGQAETSIDFEGSLIRANVRLPSARSIEGIKLQIKFREGEVTLPSFPSPYQKVITADKKALTLSVERPKKPEKSALTSYSREAKNNPEIREYLLSNAYLNIDDPLIQKVVREVTQESSNSWEKALRLRDWVSQNIVFDAGIVFAPSNEVIRQRRGTCVSFAVLLATLARAAGLPARFILGYAYVNGVWGGHAWTELYLAGTWLPFDAALPSPDIADAARVAIVATSLNQGLGETVVAGQRFFSQVEMEILEYRLDGKSFLAPPQIYEIRGNKYQNFGLQIVANKPDSFSFAETDRVWPDNTLLVLKADKAEIRLRQHAWRPVNNWEKYLRQLAGAAYSRLKLETFVYKGKTAYKLVGKNQAVAYFLRGTDLWEISAQGPEAANLLEEAFQAIHFED